MGMNELKAKPESCSFRKSNPSWWVAVHWMRELQLFPWWSPGCRPGRIELVIYSIALFFLDVSNHTRARWVFKWCIRENLVQKTAGLHFPPLLWWYWGNPDLLPFQCCSSVGQSSEANRFKATSLAIGVRRAHLIRTNVEDLAHHSCRSGWH